jgi:hypothetical protein
MDERRRHERWACEGPVRIEADGTVCTGRMEEMSEGNCLLMCPAYQTAGSVLRLRFRHPEHGRRVEVEVMVMRTIPRTPEDGGGFGLAVEWVSRLESVDDDDSARVTAVELDVASAEFEVFVEGDPDEEDPEDDVPAHRIRPARHPSFPVPAEFWSGSRDTVQGLLQEVSLAGIRIETVEPPSAGTIVNVRLRPEEDSPCPAVTLFGAVAWSRDGGFGLEIRGLFNAAERAVWTEYTRTFFV